MKTVFVSVCRYAVKYNEQLLLTLEEDEFSCKQRLAYKLEQVRHLGFSLYGLVFSAASAITRIPVASLDVMMTQKLDSSKLGSNVLN